MTPAPTAATVQHSAAKYGSWPLVVLLTLVGILNYFDRQLPFILAESIKHELALSDTQLGFINGLGFLLVYAILGLPVSRLSDRGLHGPVLAACIAIWSLMTSVGGLAANGWQLAAARMGVAAGEAGSTPAAHAIVAARFPVERRGVPLAILSTAAAFGAMFGLLLGGFLNDTIGWRHTFLLMGLPGFILAVITFVAIKPEPRAAAAVDRPSLMSGIVQLLRIKAFSRVVLAASVMATGTAAQVSFSPAFLMRAHDLSATSVGLWFGLIKGALGVGGLLIGGLLIDRLSRRDMRWIVWLPAVVITAALPFSTSAWSLENATVTIIFISLTNAAGLFYLAPTFSAAQALAPPHLRALASAVTLCSISIVSGFGPLAVGIISDMLNPALGDGALGRAMLVVPVMHLCGAALFVLASSRFLADTRKTAAPAQ